MEGGYVELSVELPARSGLGGLGDVLREAARGSLVVVSRIREGAARLRRHESESGQS